jgi:hypothetical protein
MLLALLLLLLMVMVTSTMTVARIAIPAVSLKMTHFK